jgi:uncharacterized membrane protein
LFDQDPMKLVRALSFFFITTLVSFGLQAQNIQFLNQESFQKLKPESYVRVNFGQETKLELDTKKDVLVDFFSTDVSTDGYDSIVVAMGKKTYSNVNIAPFMVKSGTYPLKLTVTPFLHGDTLTTSALAGRTLVISVKEKGSLLMQDTLVFGLLAIVLGLIFYTSSLKTKFWKRFYVFVPALLLCYLIPAILNTMGIISESQSNLYPMAKDYLLPAALVLMTLGIDFKGLINLGPKAIIMFLTATVGIIIGGPIAILIFSWIDPAIVGGLGYDATWRGLSTLAGSWIGGGANQAAMLETYKYNPDLYGKMVTVDIVVANLWMAFLLWAASRSEKFDKWLKADSSSIEALKTRTVNYQSSISRQPSITDYMIILGIAFGVVGTAHFFGSDLADFFQGVFGSESPFASSFFWIVVLATTGGLLLSLTKMRKYEGAGASKIGSVFIYILVVTIGMKMGLEEAVKEPMLILVGITWMLIHVGLLFLVAKLIRAPFFFVAVGSKANVGGAASAPIVAAAFHPSLASVGAILAVLGYALGTYGAIAAAEMMRYVAP